LLIRAFCLATGLGDALTDPSTFDGTDLYEVLQISPNADLDTVHRVYRLLAQRFHPDNTETGDATRFRHVHDAYAVLSDPEKRAQYDIVHHRKKQDRWRLVSTGAQTEDSFEGERLARLTVLEVLYTRRRLEPHEPGIFDLDFESVLGQPREHLEFTFWYLLAKNFVRRGDQSRLLITPEGVDYLEQHYEANVRQRRLQAAGT
jgi:curved DNA-binding protein